MCAGFLSPASRGALLTALLVMYLLLAVAAGFAAVYLWGLVNRRSAPPCPWVFASSGTHLQRVLAFS
jgi:hypothetical protein